MLSKFTVVATGGCGNIYSSTSNPVVATGDGIAMCHRAKAITENMEFIQFHPTTLYNPGEKPNFLITEAMRGFGAILRLQSGEEFMDKYHPMRSLAPRDVVARAIYRENDPPGQGLRLPRRDAQGSRGRARRHFPTSTRSAARSSTTSPKDWIPVTPRRTTARRREVDTNGETSIPPPLRAGRNLLHGAARREPADFELAHRGGRLCRPGRTPRRRSSARSISGGAFPTGISKAP